MRRRAAAAALAALLVGAATPRPAGAGDDAPAVLTYAESTEVQASPERGFYTHTETHSGAYAPLDPAALRRLREQSKITLAMRVFYLEDFVAADLSADYLRRVEADFAAARAAGFKLIVRFAYSSNEASPAPRDAPRAQVVRHLDQLRPLLAANRDVIAVLQAGFIGLWGEWYYTDHLTEQAERDRVLDAVLRAAPAERMVQLRTPRYKLAYLRNRGLSTKPVAPADAYGFRAAARLGHHNDCFLASDTDYGTYERVEEDKTLLEADTAFVAVGGETCAPNPPRSACATAAAELSRFRWSFLNRDYHPGVLAGWQDEGCYETVAKRLGARLVLRSAEAPTRVARGASLTVQAELDNVGFAALFNPRRVELVLRGENGAVTLPVVADPRRWAPGGARRVDLGALVPAELAPGNYRLLLNLADPLLDDPGENPLYALPLASRGVFEPATGYNDLGLTVRVE